CGKNSWISDKTGIGAEQAACRRFSLRNFAIGALVVLALCALAWLFFRREQPLHRLVFGDLRGPGAESPTVPPAGTLADSSGGGAGTPGLAGSTGHSAGQVGPIGASSGSAEPSGVMPAGSTGVSSNGPSIGYGSSGGGLEVPGGAAID